MLMHAAKMSRKNAPISSLSTNHTFSACIIYVLTSVWPKNLNNDSSSIQDYPRFRNHILLISEYIAKGKRNWQHKNLICSQTYITVPVTSLTIKGESSEFHIWIKTPTIAHKLQFADKFHLMFKFYCVSKV